MTKLLAWVYFLVFLSPTLSAAANSISQNRGTQIQVSTLNMKWFGIGGFMWNTPDQEYRSDNMKQFIEETLGDSDVIVFTEVVETAALIEIVKNRMDCATYQGAWSRHQHIVTCFEKNHYRAEKFDNDYIIEEVDLGSGGLRPATQVKICLKTGPCVLQVIGVHLAAGAKTEKRIRQVEFIAANLAAQSKMLPTIITGDFNSYIKEQNGGSEDDIVIFETILSKNTRGFRSVTKHIKTYNSGERARAYDHIVTSLDIKVLRTQGYEACSKEPDLRNQFIPFQSYKRYFTDHCPVSALVEVN